jgi:hypothetical protein
MYFLVSYVFEHVIFDVSPLKPPYLHSKVHLAWRVGHHFEAQLLGSWWVAVSPSILSVFLDVFKWNFHIRSEVLPGNTRDDENPGVFGFLGYCMHIIIFSSGKCNIWRIGSAGVRKAQLQVAHKHYIHCRNAH